MSRPTNNLGEWLNIATEKLSPPAKERIKLEITAHYEEGLQVQLEAGLSETDARATILAGLGDAQSAAGRFRREHLTESEARMIQRKMPGRRRWVRWGDMVSHLGLGPFLVWSRFALIERHGPGYLRLLIMAVVCLTISSSYYFHVNPSKPRPNVSVLLWMSSLKEFSYWMGLFGIGWPFSLMGGTGMLSVMLGIPSEIRLWLKVRRMSDAWQEMPPSRASAT